MNTVYKYFVATLIFLLIIFLIVSPIVVFGFYKTMFGLLVAFGSIVFIIFIKKAIVDNWF